MSNSIGHDMFCPVPFRELFLGQYVSATCCPGFVDKKFHYRGHVESLDELWNCEQFVLLREKILGGDFSPCYNCPRLRNGTLKDYRGNNTKAVLTTGPQLIEVSLDNSCQLQCPSCRQYLVTASEKQVTERLEQAKNIIAAAKYTKRINFAGSGEVFFSPVYIGVLDWLESNIEQYKDLHITIRTNGLRLMWGWARWPKTMRLVDRITISIDAASKATYEKIRLGGSWEKLLQNLQFVSELIQSNDITFKCVFVVQRDNFHEMGDFVEFVSRYGCSKIFYNRFGKLGQTDSGFSMRNVMDESHPQHQQYLISKQDPRLQNPIVCWW